MRWVLWVMTAAPPPRSPLTAHQSRREGTDARFVTDDGNLWDAYDRAPMSADGRDVCTIVIIAAGMARHQRCVNGQATAAAVCCGHCPSAPSAGKRCINPRSDGNPRKPISPRCSGPQTASDGLANNVGFEPTIHANRRGREPTFGLLATCGDERAGPWCQ